MRKLLMTSLFIGIAVAGVGCKKKKGKKPLGDKNAACTNIYNVYSSRQDMKVWMDACMAAPDENVRCINLVMEEGKDDDCKKLVSSPERTQLVTILNGTPEKTPPPTSDDAGPAAAGGADGG